MESELAKSDPSIKDVLELLREMREENNQRITELERDIGKSVESGHEKIEELTKVVKEQSEALKNFDNMYSVVCQENLKLKEKVNTLEQRLEDMEQYSRLNCVEINNIPETKDEDVLEIVKKVGSSLDFMITDEMVDACHRVGQKSNKRTRGIIVKFTRRMTKDEILKRRRKKQDLSTRDVGYNDTPKETVYLNENLTSYRRKVLNAAKDLKKEMGFKYLWVRNGKILLRKKDNENVIVLTTLVQVTELEDNKTTTTEDDIQETA
ncbi:uncharacterized protein LOC128984177 [Macrosteles quadrilineatus]|uniref:uncharacterized protein LOC128984177 n=1 Tax=Macrosteles quadrilineatus TaxID=74068 RepID=UPI0023E17BA0|nr:uncharacterized protein LOC128984177 [Macrosteles quadrilineatus]